MDSIPENRLGNETSPYLLQHAHNPVAWQPWNDAALARARIEEKPILLSIGYSACHWCHVMAHESFEDEETAAVMNRLFVNIKVDREERPDLDQIYQTAHQMLTGRHGGWPLTLFLTPDGAPFFGGTYFPPEPRYGLPGFAGLCEQIGAVWHKRRGEIEAQNRELLAALNQPSPPAAGTPDVRPIGALRALLLGSFDCTHGGFGGAPKFPHPSDLAFLLQRQDDPEANEAALFTLRCMADGGIHDQLGGGFCRYSVDAEWTIPHFEKMLYDNGPLLGLYADAWALTGDETFLRIAENVSGWVLREMRAPEGGFYSSLDADSEGEEGKFYVWDRTQVARLLTPEESALAGRHWGLDGPPNFEGHHWHLKIDTPLRDEERALLESARTKLFAARSERVRPGCDDKILTSWNALMIAGLTHAARICARADWLVAARTALDFLKERHWQNGRLLATSRHGRAHLSAYLDDHAFLLAALLEMLQAEFRSEDLAFARQIAEVLLEHFEDAGSGGFFFTAHDHEALIQRSKNAHDGSIPSGNAIAALSLQRLGHLLGEVRFLDAARRTVITFWPHLERHAGGMTSLIQALEEMLIPPAVVILRGPEAEMGKWQQLLAARKSILAFALPNGMKDLPPSLAKPETAHVNAWACRGVSCHAPVASQADLDKVLQHI